MKLQLAKFEFKDGEDDYSVLYYPKGVNSKGKSEWTAVVSKNMKTVARWTVAHQLNKTNAALLIKELEK